MAQRRHFEVLFIIDASSSRAAELAANAAWYAIESASGCESDAYPRERLPDGRVVDVDWKDWDEEGTVSFSVQRDE